MPVMSSLGRTLLFCRGAAATPGARAALAEPRSEPWDLTGDADFVVVINVAPFSSQIREQTLVPEPRPGGNKQRSTELCVCNHHHVPIPQQAPRVQGWEWARRSPHPEQGSPEAASAATGGSALRLPRRDRPAALRQPEPSALAPALPSLTPAPLCAKCNCSINREAEQHKTPRLASHHTLPPLPVLACPGTGTGRISSQQRVDECCLSPLHLSTRRPLNSKGSICELLGRCQSGKLVGFMLAGNTDGPSSSGLPQLAFAGKNLLALSPDLGELQ